MLSCSYGRHYVRCARPWLYSPPFAGGYGIKIFHVSRIPSTMPYRRHSQTVEDQTSGSGRSCGRKNSNGMLRLSRLFCLTAIPLVLGVSPLRKSPPQWQSQEHVPTRTATPTDSDTLHEIFIKKLFDPTYPPLAKQTRQYGDVQLQLTIRPDGTIESAEVLSGPPLLRDAALSSAEKSTFECRNCKEGPTFYLMTYSFNLSPTIYCSATAAKPDNSPPDAPYPRISHSQNHITVEEQPIGTCDLPATIGYNKVRSIKCLYLWRCARQQAGK